MKTFFLLFIVILTETLNAQQRDVNFYLNEAKSNSPLIHKAINDNKLIQFDLQQIKTILSKPEINLEANVLFAPIISHDNGSSHFELTSKGALDYTGYDLAVTDGGQYQAYVAVKQALFTASKYRIYSSKAEVLHQINENTIALTNHEIDQLVRNQYIICLKSKKQIEISSALLNELKTQLLQLQKLVENAIYKQTDLMLLQIEYQNYAIENQKNKMDYSIGLCDLNLICGISDTNNVEIRDVDFQINSDKIINSNFLIAYKLDSIKIVNEQIINEVKYKPQLNLFANTGLNAVCQPSLNRLGFSAGVNLSWNIFDGNQRKIQRAKSSINLQTLEFEKKYFVNQNELNKNKMQLQIEALTKSILLTEDQLNQYDKLIEVYNKELIQGEISVMDYKNLLKDIAAKKQESLVLKMEKQAVINSYNYWNY
ncbi:MAG: TolC family protein [Bacteroidales bacterium]